MMTLLSEAMQMSNSIHDAESFLEYGCWCASNPSSNGYDLTKGKSAPVDNIDRWVATWLTVRRKWPCILRLCRSTAQCHMCLELDEFEEECDFYQSYNYTFLNNRTSVFSFHNVFRKFFKFFPVFLKTWNLNTEKVWSVTMRKDHVPGHHVNVTQNSSTVLQTWRLNGIQSITLEAVSEPVLEF